MLSNATCIATRWDAETLFLDGASGTGAFVRPWPGRLVLMDQDVTHRVSPPSHLARRPRYSLVWKLVFFPKTTSGGAATIVNPEWGLPSPIGSAAKLAAIMAALRRSGSGGGAGKRRREEGADE